MCRLALFWKDLVLQIRGRSNCHICFYKSHATESEVCMALLTLFWKALVLQIRGRNNYHCAL